MKPYYPDNHIKIYNKDCRDMSEVPDNSIQCVVTSPPYWGLRKYAGEQELIWGDNHCEHEWVDVDRYAGGGQPSEKRRWQHTGQGASGHPKLTSGLCSLCGAWRGAFGLEPTPEMYVQHTIEILREIRRVLRKDGVVFWNIRDSYAGGKGTCFNPGGGKGSFSSHGDRKDAGAYPLDRGNISMLKASGLKPKDLCLIPQRIMIAAQEDGWWVRSDIVWNKPNPMPESVRDRPTRSHEYIVMLTKSARYYWDQEAVRRDYKQSSIDRADGSKVTTSNPDRQVRFKRVLASGANLRTVWEFPTQPFPSFKIDGKKVDHFAVFPEKLPELCIKAATPEVGCCAVCGTPWKRTMEKTDIVALSAKGSRFDKGKTGIAGMGRVQSGDRYESQQTGWQPTCKCNAARVPSLVLDPLAGAGTTLLVAKNLNRYAVGYEISGEYCQLAGERCRQQVLL